jgi:hypothetical protein
MTTRECTINVIYHKRFKRMIHLAGALDVLEEIEILLFIFFCSSIAQCIAVKFGKGLRPKRGCRGGTVNIAIHRKFTTQNCIRLVKRRNDKIL